MTNREQLFELIRFAVPVEWSDWAVNDLVDRIVAEQGVPEVMSSGLTIEQRRQAHVEVEKERRRDG